MNKPAARPAVLSASVVRYRSDELQSVASVVVLGDGTCLALDPTTPSISAFDSKGLFIKSVGRRGSGPGEFADPVAMAASPDGRVFVWDPGNNRVMVFASGLKVFQTFHLQASPLDVSSLMWFNDDRTVSIASNVRRKGAKPNPELPSFGFPGAILRVSEQGAPIDTT